VTAGDYRDPVPAPTREVDVASYIIRRVLISLVLLLVASFVCFALVQMLGDPLAE